MLHHFVCWYVKCVEKVPFRKSGHICLIIVLYVQPYCVRTVLGKKIFACIQYVVYCQMNLFYSEYMC